MVTPSAHPGLSTLPLTRRALLNLLKRRGEVHMEDLATATEMTVSGVRQQLAGLQRDGLVTFREVREGPGRPRHFYRLTPAADSLFPRAYAELTNELLSYVGEADPQLIEAVFARRRERRIERARTRLHDLTLDDKVAELTRILDEDGYLAQHRVTGHDEYLVTENNCAVLGVALRYGQACSSEIEFIRAVLPEAEVERVSHIASGAHHCSYRIVAR